MKKEAVNTFSGGLNYDLNPITTPNNVLTECINGTFITFNGDELALQNDAGNTKILVPGTIDQWVQLSNGFYPLEIKEYGGVLYIVSGKSVESNAIQAVINYTYNVGDLVFNMNGDTKLYYLCKIRNTLSNLSDLLNLTNWESNILNIKNLYEEIEFGSYPSPENFSTQSISDSISFDFKSATTDNISKSNIINNIQFKAGEYVTFTPDNTSFDYSNISYPTYTGTTKTGYVTKIYKVRLLQQLTNGFIDLTDDVWDKYATYINNNHSSIFTYWFNDKDFKYHCPNNFKGKLAIVIDIEPISLFQLNYSTINFINNKYVINFNVTLNNNTTFIINYILLEYKLDGIAQTPIIISLSGNTGIDEIILDTSNKGKLLTYTLKPIFIFNGNDITIDLPSDYLNNYTINGNKYITANFDNLVILKEPTSQANCETDPTIGYSGYSVCWYLTLQDSSGNNLNNSLEISSDKYQFYLAGQTAPTHSLGTFTVDTETNKAILDPTINSISGIDIIRALVNNTIVRKIDNSCTSTPPSLPYIHISASYNSTFVTVTADKPVASDITVSISIFSDSTTSSKTMNVQLSTGSTSKSVNAEITLINSVEIDSINPAIDSQYNYVPIIQ